MHRFFPLGTFAAIAGAALALAGCNEAAGSMINPTATSAPVLARAQGGAGCGAEIDRFQAIVTSDHDTGNVDQKVFEQIESELSRASAACAAGRGLEAHAIVSSSKAHHGYRA